LDSRGRLSLQARKITAIVLSVDETKIYISFFTIKKKHAVACCPRVSTSHLRRTSVCYVAIFTNIPNSLREYRIGLRLHPTPTPQESFLLLFFKKEEKTRVLLLHKLTTQKEKAQP
jgi:hypothetical protein